MQFDRKSEQQHTINSYHLPIINHYPFVIITGSVRGTICGSISDSISDVISVRFAIPGSIREIRHSICL
jgi:hypothetical protein